MTPLPPPFVVGLGRHLGDVGFIVVTDWDFKEILLHKIETLIINSPIPHQEVSCIMAIRIIFVGKVAVHEGRCE